MTNLWMFAELACACGLFKIVVTGGHLPFAHYFREGVLAGFSMSREAEEVGGRSFDPRHMSGKD
jgi:hypothetical protein